MIDIRSYLVRAWRAWIIDNQLTPHLVLNCKHKGIIVPSDYQAKDTITLNISPGACQDFELTKDFISFSARFNGHNEHIYSPIMAIQGIYALENNHGMWFDLEKQLNNNKVDTVKKRPKFQVID